LGIINPSALTVAPSVDSTDDPNIYDLFVLDNRQIAKQDCFPLQAHGNKPQYLTVKLLNYRSLRRNLSRRELRSCLPHWYALLTLPFSSPHSSIASHRHLRSYVWGRLLPLTSKLLIVDSEVEEMSNYFQGKNVYQSTTSGTLGATCSTTSYSSEPSGVAINPNNNHILSRMTTAVTTRFMK
jgi:hypothetical protein